MKIEVILFDAAGTLLHLSKPVGEGYAEVAKRHGIGADPGILDSSFRECWGLTPPPNSRSAGSRGESAPDTPPPAGDDSGEPPARRGDEGGDEDERHWWRGLVDRVFERSGIRVEQDRMDACFDELYDYYGQASAWRLFEEVPRILEVLRRQPRVRLAIASNFDTRLRSVLRGHGIDSAFESIHLSSELRVSKPSPLFFRKIVDSSGVPAPAHLHVGDDPELDWAAASHAGLEVYPLDRRRTDLHGLLDDLARRDI